MWNDHNFDWRLIEELSSFMKILLIGYTISRAEKVVY